MAVRNRKTFWSADWFVGIVFAAAFFVLAYVLARPFFYGLETSFYDRGLALKNVIPSDRVAVVAIDDESIANIGRWPWSRDVLAAGIDRLSAGQAKVIVSTVLLSEAQIDSGVDYLRDLGQFVGTSALSAVADETLAADTRRLQEKIELAIDSVDYDGRLASAIANAGNVILPLEFRHRGQPAGHPDAPTPDFLQNSRLAVPARALDAPAFHGLSPPIRQLGEPALAIGHTIKMLDFDGGVRFEPLVADYYGELYPSLALVTAARALNLDNNEIEILPGKGLRLGSLHIGTTPQYLMYNHYYASTGGRPPFSVDSFYDVFTGRVPVDKFRGKVVLIGADARGVGDNLSTPVSRSTAPVLVLAHTVSSLLNADFVTRPPWTGHTELAVFLLLAFYLVVVLPALKAGWAAFISLVLALSMLGAQLQLLTVYSIWLQLVVPLVFLLSGHLVITVKRFGVTERLKQRSDEAGAESNRMLGLAFQNQGQLDMAFEKFRRCPNDDSMMEPLYNLALDYERKRQHNKAATVYSLMSEHDPGYRDLPDRLRRNQALEETIILGSAGSKPYTEILLDGEDLQKPMLGRYQIEKEIGKGAMGTVYLGRDPKINRVVAIKTIALSQEFDEDEVDAVRERFFREAETVGRLNHPDIVTIYDAGEEHDLAYIAMEFLKGSHLNPYTRPDNLLPQNTVVRLTTRVAEALAYAHKEDVVHRDIKPANIMYNAATGDLKITDFGIARITSSSRTKTGIVLGTPSYMSPEQLAGKNVTGRSDLFSLGVTLYQLLTGQLPFRADSMASLMYKIANEDHTPLRAARPELPVCLEEVISRALCKDADLRYQSGSQMALDLQDCIAHLAA